MPDQHSGVTVPAVLIIEGPTAQVLKLQAAIQQVIKSLDLSAAIKGYSTADHGLTGLVWVLGPQATTADLQAPGGDFEAVSCDELALANYNLFSTRRVRSAQRRQRQQIRADRVSFAPVLPKRKRGRPRKERHI